MLDSPPVRRKLFNLAAAVSLVLCVATIVLWHRTLDADPMFADPVYFRVFSARAAGGQVEFVGLADRYALFGLRGAEQPTLASMCEWNAIGFGFGRRDLFGTRRIVIPLWFVVAISLLLPAVQAARAAARVHSSTCRGSHDARLQFRARAGGFARRGVASSGRRDA